MENLPIEPENGFIGKIKKFFRNIFGKKEHLNVVDTNEKKIDVSNKTSVFEEMQRQSKKLENEEFIIYQTVKNPELIKNLSEDKKKKLEELYDKKIRENDEIIAMNNEKIAYLKNKLNRMQVN